MALHVAVLPLVENIAPCTKGGEDGEGPAPEMSRGGYGGGPQPEAAQRLALGDAEPGTRAEQIHRFTTCVSQLFTSCVSCVSWYLAFAFEEKTAISLSHDLIHCLTEAPPIDNSIVFIGP